MLDFWSVHVLFLHLKNPPCRTRMIAMSVVICATGVKARKPLETHKQPYLVIKNFTRIMAI